MLYLQNKYSKDAIVYKNKNNIIVKPIKESVCEIGRKVLEYIK